MAAGELIAPVGEILASMCLIDRHGNLLEREDRLERLIEEMREYADGYEQTLMEAQNRLSDLMVSVISQSSNGLIHGGRATAFVDPDIHRLAFELNTTLKCNMSGFIWAEFHAETGVFIQTNTEKASYQGFHEVNPLLRILSRTLQKIEYVHERILGKNPDEAQDALTAPLLPSPILAYKRLEAKASEGVVPITPYMRLRMIEHLNFAQHLQEQRISSKTSNLSLITHLQRTLLEDTKRLNSQPLDARTSSLFQSYQSRLQKEVIEPLTVQVDTQDPRIMSKLIRFPINPNIVPNRKLDARGGAGGPN